MLIVGTEASLSKIFDLSAVQIIEQTESMKVAAMLFVLYFNLVYKQFLDLNHVESKQKVVRELMQFVFWVFYCTLIGLMVVEALESLSLRRNLVLNKQSIFLKNNNDLVLLDVDHTHRPFFNYKQKSDLGMRLF